MVVAQRLVRRICKDCAAKRKITQEEFSKITEALEETTEEVKLPAFSKDSQILEPKGCPKCNFTGYKGRIAIFEAFLRTDEIESLILKKPSIPEIRKAALKQGMVTMFQDGMLKVAQGLTTIKEVKRVAMED